MKVTDVKGMYTLEVNTKGTIVKEKQSGAWKSEDMKRYQKDYESKIAPLLKGKKWAKCCDLIDYKMSMIVEDMAQHVKWATDAGLTSGAIIVSNIVVKMQMKRGDAGLTSPEAFVTEKEALDYLSAQGFNF